MYVLLVKLIIYKIQTGYNILYPLATLEFWSLDLTSFVICIVTLVIQALSILIYGLDFYLIIVVSLVQYTMLGILSIYTIKSIYYKLVNEVDVIDAIFTFSFWYIDDIIIYSIVILSLGLVLSMWIFGTKQTLELTNVIYWTILNIIISGYLCKGLIFYFYYNLNFFEIIQNYLLTFDIILYGIIVTVIYTVVISLISKIRNYKSLL